MNMSFSETGYYSKCDILLFFLYNFNGMYLLF